MLCFFKIFCAFDNNPQMKQNRGLPDIIVLLFAVLVNSGRFYIEIHIIQTAAFRREI